jgi:hypothetical protein
MFGAVRTAFSTHKKGQLQGLAFLVTRIVAQLPLRWR